MSYDDELEALYQGYYDGTTQTVEQILNTVKAMVMTADHIKAGTIDARLVTVKSQLTGSAYVQIDGLGIRAFDGTRNTFEINSNGDAIFAGDVIGGRVLSNSTVEVTTDLKVGKNTFMGAENDTDTVKNIYFYFNSKTSPTIVPASIQAYLVSGGGKGIRIDASEEVKLSCGSSEIKQFLDSINSKAVIDYISTSPSTFPLEMRVNGGLKVTGSLDVSTATVTGLSTESVTDHNHGITPGRYIQTYDSAGNPLGLQAWVASGGHSHPIV